MNDYYSLLEVRREANSSEISVAYRRIIRDKYQRSGYDDQISNITKAYRTLSNPAKRKEYDLLLQKVAGKYILQNPNNPTSADTKYLAGINAMERKNFSVAVDYFKQSIKLDPEKSHFYSHLGLAIGMFTGKLTEAERYCKRAIELEPDNPELCYNLGFLYQRHNLVEAAQQAFLQAQEAEQKRWNTFFRGDNGPIEALWAGEAREGMKEAKTKEESEVREIKIQPEEQMGQTLPPNEEGKIRKKETVENGVIEKASASSGEKIFEKKKNRDVGMFSGQIILAEIIDGSNDKTPDTAPALSIGPADNVTVAAGKIPSNEIEKAETVTMSFDTEKPTNREQQPAALLENNPNQAEALLLTEGHPKADELEDLFPEITDFSTTDSSSGISTGDGRLLMEINPHQEMDSEPAVDAAHLETADNNNHNKSQSLEELENEALSLLKELGLAPSQIDSLANPEADGPTSEPKEMEMAGEEKSREDNPVRENDENPVAELKKLEEMEKKMAEDLIRLKEERKKLKKKINGQ